jgi:hypothetical protein
MQQSIVTFIALSCRYRSTCFGHCCAHHQEPPPTAFAASCYRMIAGLDVFQAVAGLLVNRPTRQSYGNQRLQRQLEGLLMMGTTVPETCWAVSTRQSNKCYDWLLHLVGCFIEYLKTHGTTNSRFKKLLSIFRERRDTAHARSLCFEGQLLLRPPFLAENKSLLYLNYKVQSQRTVMKMCVNFMWCILRLCDYRTKRECVESIR